MDLINSMRVSASGLDAQALRMQIIAENIANADSVVGGPDGGPYRRQIVSFQSQVDQASGMVKVVAQQPRPDMVSPLRIEIDPASPYADEQGIVRKPNVTPSNETVDLREASRMYEANLQVIEAAKGMAAQSINLLR